jgi:signal transduction histidine kinase
MGSIILRIIPKGENLIKLEVEDTGIGIKKED